MNSDQHELLIGGRTVPRGDALDHARHYLTDRAGWAYPAYDGFEVARATGPLTDADLLAPVLLNVSHLSIRTYEALQSVRADLQQQLARIPLELDLADAGAQELRILGDLFAVLDNGRVWGARGTVLAKVLHRKRPRFIPLYDEHVRSVYQDGPHAPVPPIARRSWAEFAAAFGAAVRDDLCREASLWDEIAGLAPGPPISRLRALDIVAWWAGRGRQLSPSEAIG